MKLKTAHAIAMKDFTMIILFLSQSTGQSLYREVKDKSFPLAIESKKCRIGSTFFIFRDCF